MNLIDKHVVFSYYITYLKLVDRCKFLISSFCTLCKDVKDLKSFMTFIGSFKKAMIRYVVKPKAALQDINRHKFCSEVTLIQAAFSFSFINNLKTATILVLES